MGFRLQDSVTQRFDAALHRPVRRLFAVVFQAQALGGVAHLGFKHAIEATQCMFDNGGAGRAVHAVDAQAFMHITLVYRRAGRGDQLADFSQADALRVVMQAQPRLAVFADDMRLINVLALEQRDQSLDAGIPLVRDVRQHERQIEYQFVSSHRGQHAVEQAQTKRVVEMPNALTNCQGGGRQGLLLQTAIAQPEDMIEVVQDHFVMGHDDNTCALIDGDPAQ